MATVLLVLCVAASFLDGYLAVECDNNEVWTACPTPCAEYCPTNETDIKEEVQCVTPEVCPEDSCQCIFNYRRLRVPVNEKGPCVPIVNCPLIDCRGPNEYFDLCPPFCPTDDCSDATPDGRCNRQLFISIVLPCAPRCRCVKGHWRKNGVCVPYREC